ncbi:VOC family protein [Arthrobacter sp. B1805]|uniref:VOC family protein n=1 Tax=Arthrobacter sp. B1805 TaxID=2058892 RepID=UPI000CE4E5DF|nr:VOC family protein [Arthrobacter sp. B1805]
MKKISGWHHIAYPVPNIETSTEWYCRALQGEVVMRQGFSEIDRRAGRTPQVWIRVGDAVINLAEGLPLDRQSHFYHYALNAPSDSLDGWIDDLRREGVNVLGPYGHGGTSMLSLYFDDPDGYRLEIVFDLGDYETAKTAALARGGALGNPESQYKWE